VTAERLDTVINVSFATMLLGLGYSQFAPESGGSIALFLWLAGMAGVAVAGFWRARFVRKARMPLVAVSGAVVRPAIAPLGQARRSETLRDLGLIAFLIGLLLLVGAYLALFIGPPNPNLALTGGAVTLIGALALAKRYRFFAVLVVCFAVPVGIIGAFVLWPPSFWVLLALGFGWLLVRRWRRAHPRPHA